jgi:hypothetical protein
MCGRLRSCMLIDELMCEDSGTNLDFCVILWGKDHSEYWVFQPESPYEVNFEMEGVVLENDVLVSEISKDWHIHVRYGCIPDSPTPTEQTQAGADISPPTSEDVSTSTSICVSTSIGASTLPFKGPDIMTQRLGNHDVKACVGESSPLVKLASIVSDDKKNRLNTN